VAAVGYAQAKQQLADALANLQSIRLEQEAKQPEPAGPEALAAAPKVEPGHPRLALDEFEHTDVTQRPHLPLHGKPTGPLDRAAAAPPGVLLSSLLSPMELDPLTVADDSAWLERVAAETNLPGYLATALRTLYT
jgi:hypothetical protein